MEEMKRCKDAKESRRMKKIIFVIGKVFITGGLFMLSWIVEESTSEWLNDKWKEKMHEE